MTGTQPDIIHVHEWQTGALPILYWDMYHYLSLKVLPSHIATVPTSSFLTDNNVVQLLIFAYNIDIPMCDSLICRNRE